jgi:glycosyltransferase involved in cell wall biosynthesis
MDEICKTDLYPPVATEKHQWNIIRGLEEASKHPLDLMSVFPVSDYPKSPHIFVSYKRWKHHRNCNDIVAPFINIIVLKHFTQFISLLILISKWLVQNRNDRERIVLINTMHSPFIYASLVATHLFGGKRALIIADLPMGSWSPKNFIKRILKPVNSFLLLRMVKLMDGVIVLTEQIARDYAANVPAIVVEGIVNQNAAVGEMDISSLPEIGKRKKTIMYAGLLEEAYGVKLLLNSFSLIEDKSYRLWIFGRGYMEKELKEAAKSDERIVYCGFVPNEEIMLKESQATVLVNPRPSHKRFTSYSFPSKLLEYMSIGRPVVSTKLPGIPKEYHDYIYLLEDETPEGLARLLQDVCSKEPKELNDFGQRAKNFVLNNKNYLRQGQKVYEFFKNL